jgi:glutamine---fructose-6-phosphate transaminase (isomerizing)
MLAPKVALARGTLPEAEIARLSGVLLEIPAKAAEILEDDGPIRRLAARIAEARDVPYLGRGACFPSRSRAR